MNELGKENLLNDIKMLVVDNLICAQLLAPDMSPDLESEIQENIAETVENLLTNSKLI